MKVSQLFFSIIALAFVNRTSAQEIIRASVTDAKTKEAMAYVNVAVSESSYGTATSIDGTFQLFIRSEHRDRKLKISFIGYKTIILSIDSLVRTNSNAHISLNPEAHYLDEVTVRASLPDPVKIIKNVIGSVNKNYAQHPFDMVMYSSIRVPKQTGISDDYNIESIVKGYYEGYGPKRKRFFKAEEKRETGNDPLSSLNFGYIPSWEIQSADLILDSRNIGIFNTDNLGDFEFKYDGTTMYEQDTVYVISYKLLRNFAKVTKSRGKESNHHGKLFVTTATNAVVKHSFTLVHDYEISYKRIGDKFFPYFLKGYRTGQLKVENKMIPIIMSNEIIVTDINLTNPQVIGEKDQVLMLNGIPYNENFWKKYYPRL